MFDKCYMDFEGQQRAEVHSRYIITLFGIVGLIWGVTIQEFSQTIYILGAGVILAAVLTIPPWPIYRRARALNWKIPRPEHAYRSHWGRKKRR